MARLERIIRVFMLLQFVKGLTGGALVLAVGLGSTAALGADYKDHPLATAFVERMVTEHDFDRDWVLAVIGQAEKKQSILDAIARPAERTLEWHEYRKIFMDGDRIEQGVEFWQENAEFLAEAERRYGVEPEVIVAIIGVETRYGRHMGGHRVIDALTTLGFDYPPRAKFFASELEHFLLLVREQKQDPLTLKGSYAGAMGYGQFISSSYRHYARDGDGDGLVDIWGNQQDAIASVANYIKAHGWQTGRPIVALAKASKKVEPDWLYSGKRPSETLQDWQKRGLQPVSALEPSLTAVPVRLVAESGPEYWLGFNNFYVITRYNRSQLYAMAVWELSQAIQSKYQQQL